MKYRAIKQGLRLVETPIVFVDRRVGQSKMSRAIVAEALLKVWALRFGAVAERRVGDAHTRIAAVAALADLCYGLRVVDGHPEAPHPLGRRVARARSGRRRSSEPVFVPTTDELEPGQQVIIEVVVAAAAEQGADPRRGPGLAPRPAPHARARRRDDRARGRRADQADVPPRGVRRQAHRRAAPPPPPPAGLGHGAATGSTNSSSYVDSAISEIGVGGALLTTPEPLPIDTELTLEVVPPGGAAPIAIAGRVSYHVAVGRLGAALRQPRRRRRSPAARADPPPAGVVNRPGRARPPARPAARVRGDARAARRGHATALAVPRDQRRGPRPARGHRVDRARRRRRSRSARGPTASAIACCGSRSRPAPGCTSSTCCSPQLLEGLLERLGEPRLFDEIRFKLAGRSRREPTTAPRARDGPARRPPADPDARDRRRTRARSCARSRRSTTPSSAS